MRLEINNFEKFNPRTDRKKHSWFRLENDFINDEKLFKLSPLEKFVWVSLLAFRSKKLDQIFDLDLEYLADQLKIKEAVISSAIQKLSDSKALTIHDVVTTGNQLVSTGSPTNVRTNVTNERTNGQNKFDLESLYFLYPRKIGKKEGFKKLNSMIHSLEQFEAVKTSIKNYAEYCRSKASPPKYIKHFDSFLSVWEDYRDPVVESAHAPLSDSIFEGTPA